MVTNRLKRNAAAGQMSLMAGNFESPDMVDLIGSLGLFDGVWIDMEHGAATVQDLADMSRAADLWGMTSIVRVRSNDPTIIGLTMSQGVHGVIVPQVTTREEAESVVAAAKVPPVGHRGASSGRRSYGRSIDEHMKATNDESFVAVMIEDIAGVDNLSGILEVQHIDMFFVSRYDLAQSLGLQTDVRDPALVQTFDRAIEQIVAAGKVAGAVVGPGDLQKYVSMGVLCIKVPPWQNFIESGARAFAAQVDAVRSSTPESARRPADGG